jgi:hypothetical protein
MYRYYIVFVQSSQVGVLEFDFTIVDLDYPIDSVERVDVILGRLREWRERPDIVIVSFQLLNPPTAA